MNAPTLLHMSTSIDDDLSRFSMKRLSHRIGVERNDKSIQQMVFIGTRQVMTSPISISKSKPEFIQLLNAFFSNDLNRNLLFPNNNAETFNMEDINDDLIETWAYEATLGGGQSPLMNENDQSQITSATTKQAVFKIDALLNLPGLKIISQSTIGMKLILSKEAYPEYQFTLLDSKLIPQGSVPVVWLFKKLTKYRDTTSSFTKVRMEEVDEGKIIFVTDARLETRINLPPKLLKVLPNVNVAKFEKQGSEAVHKLLEKELEPALNGFCDACCAFMLANDDDISVTP